MGFAWDRDPLVWDHRGIGYDCTCNVEDHSRISTMCGPEVIPEIDKVTMHWP